MKKTRAAARSSRGIKKLSPRFKRFSPLGDGERGEGVGVVHAPFDSRRFYPSEYFFFFIAGRETRDANFLGCED